MTAEEYVKHYASGQGGFESVSVDVALRAIEYAKQEAKQKMMANAVDGTLLEGHLIRQKGITRPLQSGDKVKLIIIKED